MKQAIGLSIALGLALIGSYLTWTDESEVVGDSEVVVYTASETDLKKLTWTSDDAIVVAERRSDAQGDHVWVTATDRKKKKIDKPEPEEPEEPEEPLPGAEDGSEPDDPHAGLDLDKEEDEGVEGVDYEIEETTRSFKGNDAADKLWAGFAPLKSLRELKPSGSVDAATFGLDEPEATIEVVRPSGALSLEVGGETYGSKDRYVRYDGRIFLIDDGTLRPLQYASSRLIDRNLQPLGEPDLETLSVDLNGQTLTFTQQNRDDRAKAFWARGDKTDSADDVAGTWIGKVLRLRLKDYLAEADRPADLTPVVGLTYTGDGQTWRVQILHSETESLHYAQSDYSRAVVSLTPSLADSVVEDLSNLLE